MPKKTYSYQNQSNRLYFMVSFKRKLCLGNKIAKNRDCQYNDLGKPQFFYEIVQYWVAFELVQVLHKFGLNPEFKTNLNRWSNDMHCVVQYMKKNTTRH